MICGLCESPLTFQAITIWRDELLSEDILLRDVIDLETTFGRPDGRGRRENTVVDTPLARHAPRKEKRPQELDADGNPIAKETMTTRRQANMSACCDGGRAEAAVLETLDLIADDLR